MLSAACAVLFVPKTGSISPCMQLRTVPGARLWYCCGPPGVLHTMVLMHACCGGYGKADASGLCHVRHVHHQCSPPLPPPEKSLTHPAIQ
eukprot:1256314-Rhodomonas_salina.2